MEQSNGCDSREQQDELAYRGSGPQLSVKSGNQIRRSDINEAGGGQCQQVWHDRRWLLRIPVHVGPRFRGMPGQDSGRCRPPFRGMPAGVDVGRVNHGYRGLFSSGKGIDGGAAEVTRAEDSRDLAAQGRWIQ